jgi:hypothetical protein
MEKTKNKKWKDAGWNTEIPRSLISVSVCALNLVLAAEKQEYGTPTAQPQTA